MIVLFKGEITPRYRKFLACLVFYISQPDCRVVDERSEIIEVDFEFRQFNFLILRHIIFSYYHFHEIS